MTSDKIAVFYNSEAVTEVGEDWYEKLKRCAYEADMKRARFCLHHDPSDPLHEMIIVFHRDTVVRPHRHHGKSESFHLIFGEIDIILFDNEGTPSRLVQLGERYSNKSQVYRLNSAAWHSVLIRTEYAAIHEVTDGPFRAEENDFAPWAPNEPDQLRRFLHGSRKQLKLGR